MTKDFGNKIKFMKIDEDNGIVIVRFSWEGTTQRKLTIEMLDLLGYYVLKPFNKWEQDRIYKVKKEDLVLKEWKNVIVELIERKEED